VLLQPTVSPEEAKERIDLLESLMKEFADAAAPLAKTIIEEEDLKNDDRSITSVKIGVHYPIDYSHCSIRHPST
jgi:hypothetical protein